MSNLWPILCLHYLIQNVSLDKVCERHEIICTGSHVGLSVQIWPGICFSIRSQSSFLIIKKGEKLGGSLTLMYFRYLSALVSR